MEDIKRECPKLLILHDFYASYNLSFTDPIIIWLIDYASIPRT